VPRSRLKMMLKAVAPIERSKLTTSVFERLLSYVVGGDWKPVLAFRLNAICASNWGSRVPLFVKLSRQWNSSACSTVA